MRELTPEGEQIVGDIANRYGLSTDAVRTLLDAVVAGGGTQAQFFHQELGGGGQWMRGGMTMIGDMFNNGLKATVDNVCSELSSLAANNPYAPQSSQSQSQSGQHAGFQGQSQSQGGGQSGMLGQSGMGGGVSFFVPGPNGGASGNWWPDELGAPGSLGSQNSIRYACFPQTRRLAIEVGGQVQVYDTLDNVISGFSQQQSGDSSITFTSQYGLVRVDSLPRVDMNTSVNEAEDNSATTQDINQGVEPPAGSGPAAYEQVEQSAPAPVSAPVSAQEPAPVEADPVQPASAPLPQPGAMPAMSQEEIFSALERLGALREKEILTDEEFSAKKSELLKRL